MASLSVRKIDDDVYERLKARAAEHGVSIEEEVRRILRQVVSAPERLGELAIRLFGPDHGIDLDPQPRPPHEPRDRSRASRPRDSAGAKLGGRRFVLAPQTEIDTIDPLLVDEFLDRIFDMGGALVTDESRLSDFISFGTDAAEAAEAVTKIQSEYGIVVGIEDRLFELLRRIAGRKLEERDDTAPS
jgi:plasmid stability protein